MAKRFFEKVGITTIPLPSEILTKIDKASVYTKS